MTASLQRSSSRRARRETLEAHLFLLPWTLGFLVLTIGPILASLGLSFTDWQVGLGLKFIGFQNFVTMFTEDDQFRKSLSVTFNYSAMALPTGIVVALMMAMLLNQNVPAIGVFRTIYYLPAVTSGVAVAMLWAWIFNGEFGLLNWALDRVGIEGPAWLLSTTWALPALAVMSLWGAGALMIIYLASLQAIPGNLYEAAQIDGANTVRQFFHVTIPMLTPTILFNLVVGIIAVFQTFTNAYIMTRGGPSFATYFYVLHLYNNAFGYARMGYASALAWVLFLIVLLLTLVVLRSSQYWVFYSGERE